MKPERFIHSVSIRNRPYRVWMQPHLNAIQPCDRFCAVYGNFDRCTSSSRPRFSVVHFGCRRAAHRPARHIAKFAVVDSFPFPTSSSFIFFGRLLVAVVRIKYQRLLITSVLTYVIAKWLQSSRAQLHLCALAFRTCGMNLWASARPLGFVARNSSFEWNTEHRA